MPYLELQANWDVLQKLIDQVPVMQDEHIDSLIQSYIQQNILILNELLMVSLSNLKKIQIAKSANDIICTQARFNNEVHKRISRASENFLHASLNKITTDYDEWLQSHCDLATD